MDYNYLFTGVAKAKKPLFVISARISPLPSSALYELYDCVCLTMSERVRDTVVKRLFAQGYTKDDIKVTPRNVAVMK